MQFIKENISTESAKCPEIQARGVPPSGHLKTSSVSIPVTHRRERAEQRRKHRGVSGNSCHINHFLT